MLTALLLLACKPGAQDPELPDHPATQAQATVLPVGSAAQLPEIAPVGPGDLAAWDQDLGDGLQVLMVGPLGEQEQPRQAVVVFDRPMVPLARLDQDPVPLSCGDMAGTGRWAGTQTAVFSPEPGRFPMASEIQCRVPKGTSAADGTALEKELVFGFSTQRPTLLRSWPSDGSDSADPSEDIVLVFNQPVDPQSVLERASLPGHGALSLGSLDPEFDAIRLPKDRERVVVLRSELALDTDYRLVLDAGIRGTQGSRGSDTQRLIDFATVPPPQVQEFFPTGDQVDPYTRIRLELATRTPAEQLNGRIRIEPAPPEPFEPAEDFEWRGWSHGVRLEPMTTYTVTLEPGATDSYGQTYDKALSWTFTTGHHDTLVDAASGKQLYPATNPSTLPVRTRNAEQLYVAVTPVDSAWVINNLDEWDAFSSSGRSFDTAPLPLVTQRELDDRIHVDQVDLAPYLRDARGFLFVETWSPQDTNWRGEQRYHKALLQVSDLGTTLKLGHDGVKAWVTRLSDGQPVEGAQVRAYRGGVLRWEGVTDADGVASSPDLLPEGWESWKEPVFLVVEKDGDKLVTSSDDPHHRGTWDFDIYRGELTQPGHLRVSAFSDRGVYKPGDTVHVAAKARSTIATGMALPQGSMELTCEDPRGAELKKETVSLDAHGGVAFDLALPADMPTGTGSCELRVSAEGQKAVTWLPVQTQEYRAPSFRVQVSAPEDLVMGQTLQATGSGNYLFGAAMGGQQATWTVRSVEVTPEIPGWEAYRFGGDESAAWWEYEHQPVQELASGEDTLDAKGKLDISLELPAAGESSRPQQVEIEVQVQDPARQRVANRAHVRVHPAAFYLGLRATTGVAKAQESASVDLVAVDPTGAPQAGVPVELQVVRRTWDVVREKGMDGRWTWTSNPVDTPVESLTAKSGKQAERVSFVPPQGGYYVVKASAKDAQGRATASELGMYVAGPGASWARGDDDQVELVPDKRTYEPGETAQILVKAPKEGLMAWVTLEREGVLAQRVVKLATQAETLSVPITAEHAPNLFVSVVLTEGAPPSDSPDAGMPAHYLGYTELAVSAADRELSVDLGTDKQTYQPGEQVTVTLKAQAGEAPAAQARVVLYAVDHGVLSLTDYQTPAPFREFWGPRQLHVLTADTRTRVLDRGALLAKGAPAGGDGGSAALRSRFQTTPLWEAELETGADGTLVHSFTLPDNLTTFRVMAVVDSGAEHFGSAEQELQVSRPLLANPALPRFLRSGDAAIAGVVVHNNRDQDREVVVYASATGLELKGSPKTVTVPAHGSLEVPFGLDQAQLGDASLEFSVSAGDDQDAVRVSLPVARPRPVETMATAGASSERQVQPFALPEGVQPGVGGLSIKASPTALVGSEDSLDYLLDYPHHCLEQTSTRLMASVLAQELDPQLELAWDSAQIQEIREGELSRLGRFRHPSGGYTMWPGASEPSALATAHALEAQHRAGQEIDAEAVAFLRDFLDGAYTPYWWSEQTKRDAHARVALTLARIGHGDPGVNSALFAERQQLSLSARAGLAESIARTTGADPRTLRLVTELQGHLDIQAASATVASDPGSRALALWEGDAAPTAALVRALLVADPENPLLPRLVQGLVGGRRLARWGNTYTTLLSLQALADYAAYAEHDGLARSVRIALDKQSLAEFEFQSAQPQILELPLESLSSGDLIIEPQGMVYWEARLSYGLEQAPPRDEGFTLRRQMVVLEGSGSTGAVTPGSLVQVTLTISTPVERSFVAVVDPLPAGLEPVNTAFATTASAMDAGGQDSWSMWDTGPAAERTWSDWVFNHRELRDQGVMLYADWMPAGVHTYTYMARATTPGTYSHPAATVEQMYAPEVFGRTGSDQFVVGTPAVATR